MEREREREIHVYTHIPTKARYTFRCRAHTKHAGAKRDIMRQMRLVVAVV